MKSLFPSLHHRGISRVMLRGSFNDPAGRIRSYWRRAGFLQNPIVCLDKTYVVGHQKHAARLFFDFRSSKKVVMVIDVGVSALPKVPSTGKLTDIRMLGFCSWLHDTYPDLLKTPFMMSATSFMKFDPRMNLPFIAPGKSDVYISGIKYGFSDKRLLHSLAVELVGNQIMTHLMTKPVFRLNSERFNSHFFDAVLERATNPINRALRPTNV